VEVNKYTPEELARLPREELRQMLAEELNKEPTKIDDVFVRSLLAELQARGNDSAFADNDTVEAACEEFRAVTSKKQTPKKPWYQNWMLKVASVINNYCHYLSEKKPEVFLKLVFPKLYGVPADEADQNGIVEDNEDLETGKDLIDIINDWARTRGRFQKGTNKNPVTGTGGKQKAEEPETKPKEEPKDTEETEEEES
jgi:hypothetical protein